MKNYSDDAIAILVAIGGKENIEAVSHCETRLRFVLADMNKADQEALKSVAVVKGTFTQGGQFQVVIGPEVSMVFNELYRQADIKGDTTLDATKKVAKGHMNPLQRFMTNLSEIFAPLIPAIITGGLILGLRNIIGDIKMFEGGSKTLTEVSQFWSGVNSFLWLIGEAVFHFLPVGITWSISKKMGTTQILGIVLGITLVSPQLLNAYAKAAGAAAPFWDFGFMQIGMIGYQAQVIPAMLAGFALVYLEKGLRRVVPPMISMIVVPFFSLVPAVLLAHTILGPLGWFLGNIVSQAVYTGLTSSAGWLFALVFGFFYAPLVITGLHHMSNAIDLQLMSEFGGTMLWPMIALSNIAQGSAVLGIILANKKNKEEQQISIPATISAYLGVTEPAMFGINIKYGYPFLAAMVGSSLAAIFSVSNAIMANSIGVGGLPGILSIKPDSMALFAIAMVIAMVVPILLTILFYRGKGNNLFKKFFKR